MITRREILKLGVAALVTPAAAQAAGSQFVASAEKSERIPVMMPPHYKVIFDERFSDSRLFADEARKLGATIHGIDADITDLWYHDLYYRWKKGPATIAGMTAPESLFCLEQLARDHRMSVTFRVGHESIADDCIEHTFSGTGSLLQHDMEMNGQNWNKQIANMIMRCSSGCDKLSRATVVTPMSRRLPEKISLVSWVIAPINQA